MMKLTADIASWLKTLPGMFRADTQVHCYEQAYSASGLARSTDISSFVEQLIRSGYQAVHRGGHSGVDEYWVLALPERQAGSHKGGYGAQ